MADEKETEKKEEIEKPKKDSLLSKSITGIMVLLLIINMAVMGGMAWVIYTSHLQEKEKESIQDVILGEKQTEQHAQKKKDESTFLCPIEPFIVNLSGSAGTVYAKIEFSLELDKEGACKEVAVRKPQIRDMVIVILTSKTYEQMETQEGKQNLREEIKHAINGFLTSGVVKNVFFTQLIVH